MKNFHRASLTVLTILVMTATPGLAQEKAEDNRLILVHEEFVNPDRSADNETLIEEFLAMAPQHQHSLPFSTFTLDDGRYFYATPLEGYSGLEGFNAAWNDTMSKIGQEKMAEMMAKAEGTADHSRDSLWWERLDLSYEPEGVEVDPETATYRSWGWFYGKPGHELKIEEYLKKYIELATKLDIKRGWYTYVGDIGSDAPVYVWLEMGDSEASFAAMSEEIMKKIGDEGMQLWSGMVKHARKFEVVRGEYRPELSYTPKTAE